MRFTKMHGAGNDYVYIDCMKGAPAHPEQLAISMSDRHFGIGSGGLVLILPSQVADSPMRLPFPQPPPTQLYTMVNCGSAIYSPNCFDENGDFNGICIGTGPFKITENKLDEYVLLERFDDYWGEAAKAKTIRVRVIPDADTRFSALKSGEIMGVIDLNAIPTSLAVELEGDDHFALTTTQSHMVP